MPSLSTINANIFSDVNKSKLRWKPFLTSLFITQLCAHVACITFVVTRYCKLDSISRRLTSIFHVHAEISSSTCKSCMKYVGSIECNCVQFTIINLKIGTSCLICVLWTWNNVLTWSCFLLDFSFPILIIWIKVWWNCWQMLFSASVGVCNCTHLLYGYVLSL